MTHPDQQSAAAPPRAAPAKAKTSLRQRWRQLDANDRRALYPAAWRLLLVRLLMATIGLRKTQRLLSRRANSAIQKLQNPEPWQRRASALQRVAARLPATRCLARSLTLWWWMRRRGLDPKLRIGIQPAPPLEGHAWIECDGHLFDESIDGAGRRNLLDWREPG